jgi:hypothetical protein
MTAATETADVTLACLREISCAACPQPPAPTVGE